MMYTAVSEQNVSKGDIGQISVSEQEWIIFWYKSQHSIENFT